MSSGDDVSKKEPGHGFAGLSSLLSEVDIPPPVETKQQPPCEPATPLPFETVPAQSTGSSAGKWFLFFVVFIGGIWIISALSGNASHTPAAPSRATASPFNLVPASMPQLESAAGPSATHARPTLIANTPSNNAQPAFDKPPVGQDLVLSVAQIRYCVKASYILDGAKPAINHYIAADVDRYNRMVSDYNSRCGKYRYREGDVTHARRDVAPFRRELRAEGRHLFARRTAPKSIVRDVQRTLNHLGYNVGTADGIVGRNTRSAISAFQRNARVPVDGRITEALLARLDATVAAATSNNPTQ